MIWVYSRSSRFSLFSFLHNISSHLEPNISQLQNKYKDNNKKNSYDNTRPEIHLFLKVVDISLICCISSEGNRDLNCSMLSNNNIIAISGFITFFEQSLTTLGTASIFGCSHCSLMVDASVSPLTHLIYKKFSKPVYIKCRNSNGINNCPTLPTK